MNKYEKAFLEKHLNIIDKELSTLLNKHPELREEDADNVYAVTNSYLEIRSMIEEGS